MAIDIDPITVSVIQHRMTAIVEEMGEAMLRTSYSQILNSSRDFSAALCTGDGDLVAQAEHIPVHVGAMPWAARAVHEAFGATARPGDVYLLNDPYHGGSHLPDITAVVPVFGAGRLAFWSLNRAHQSDIGGAPHGAYNGAATVRKAEDKRLVDGEHPAGTATQELDVRNLDIREARFNDALVEGVVYSH